MKQSSRRPGDGLLQAARDGSTRRTIALLSKSLVDINPRTTDNWTPLMISADRGHSGVVEILLNKGANLSIVSKDGFTALHLAAKNGHPEVTVLLVKAGVDLETRCSRGQTPLHLAAEQGHAAVMKRLLKAGAGLEANTCRGYTPLHLAAEQGHTEVSNILVKVGADMNAKLPQGFTPLHLAAQNGHSEVTMLLTAGTNLEARISQGHTPLHLAAQNGHVEVMKLLMRTGADPNARNSKDFTPLHLASGRGRSEAVALLIKAGADLETCCNLEGSVPLHKAATGGHTEGMEALIVAGANVDARMPGGETPLLCAALKGYVGAVRVLLRSKANPLLCRVDRTTGIVRLPLDAAALNRHSEVVVELLQQLGIEGCGGESGGVDALSAAAKSRHVDIMAILADAGVVDTGKALCVAVRGGELSVKFLLRQQEGRLIGGEAYANARDHVGATPLLIAVRVSHCSPRVVRMLIDAGADTTSAVRVTDTPGDTVLFDDTPMALVSRHLHEKGFAGENTTEEHLDRLEGIRRLLLQVEAVRAVSWLWRKDIPSTIDTEDEKRENTATSTSLSMTLPVLRRRARRRGVVLAPLLRYSSRSADEDVESSPSLPSIEVA